jgi:hypothetical protein
VVRGLRSRVGVSTVAAFAGHLWSAWTPFLASPELARFLFSLLLTLLARRRLGATLRAELLRRTFAGGAAASPHRTCDAPDGELWLRPDHASA